MNSAGESNGNGRAMVDRHHVGIARVLLSASALALTACQRDDAASDRVTVVRASPSSRIAVDARRFGGDPVTRPSPVPPIATASPGPNPQLAKPAFRSPPLPPELVGDGDLVPLPPLPPASAFVTSNQQ